MNYLHHAVNCTLSTPATGASVKDTVSVVPLNDAHLTVATVVLLITIQDVNPLATVNIKFAVIPSPLAVRFGYVVTATYKFKLSYTFFARSTTFFINAPSVTARTLLVAFLFVMPVSILDFNVVTCDDMDCALVVFVAKIATMYASIVVIISFFIAYIPICIKILSAEIDTGVQPVHCGYLCLYYQLRPWRKF